MAYHQDDTPRLCSICKEAIKRYEYMIDLFRQDGARRVEWVHESCTQRAVENWIRKKEERANAK